jgi:hypothetical protein
MKKIFTFLVLSLSSIGFSQQGELHHEGQPIGSTFAIDSASSSIDHFAGDFYIVNTGVVDLNITTTRYQRAITNGWTEFVCDCDFCPAATGIVWESPSHPIIQPGDSCILQPKVYPNGIDGCAVLSYKVEGQNHTFIDSIEITFTIAGSTCNVGTKEIVNNQFNFSVYPNPASNVLNVTVENLDGKASVSVFDIVGNEVVKSNLVNGKNTLNIENLTAGIYFYSIRKDNSIIETKKIVVQ